MNHKNSITSIVFLFLGLGVLYAQESPVASGGEGTGVGGTTSYSVGQVVYTTNTGTNGSVAQGVQQPYEISVTLGIDKKTINLELSVYPNPTTNYLTLKTEDNVNLSYQLYDMQGKIIENKEITSNNTIISMEALPKATYFLKVTKDNHPDSYREVKTFKIIKN